MTEAQYTAIGLLPGDWSVEALGNLFSVSAGGDWDPEHCVRAYDASHPYPVVANALTPGATQGYCSYYRVPADTVTITGRGDVGHAVYRDEPYVPIVRLLALVPKKRLSSRFYAEYINARVSFSLESTGVPQLTAPQIRPYLLAVPPLDEQRAIAAVISDVDDFIANLERLVVKKQGIKQSLMQQLLTGRTRLPGFHDDWSAVAFESMASPARERVMPQSVSASTRLIELEHLEGSSGRVVDTATAGMASSLKSLFRPGDVLFGKLRSYLRKYWLADSYGLCSTEFWVLRPKAGFISEYLRYIVETDTFIEAASGGYGTHMPRADWGVVRRVELLVPGLAEQHAIAEILSDIDRQIEVLRTRLTKARDLKTGMMQQLLTGRTRLPVETAA